MKTPMRRFREWTARFDQLDCVTMPQSGRLALIYRDGLKRVWQAVLLTAAVGWGIVASIAGVPSSMVIAIGGGIVLVFLLTAGPRRIQLSDQVLVQAAGRAALDLGTERAPGWWRVRGPQAGALARDLRRLNRMSWPLPVGVDRALAREEQLIAAAGPELQPYLRPVLTAVEGYEPQVVPSQAPAEGELWPLLDSRPANDKPRRQS